MAQDLHLPRQQGPRLQGQAGPGWGGLNALDGDGLPVLEAPRHHLHRWKQGSLSMLVCSQQGSRQGLLTASAEEGRPDLGLSGTVLPAQTFPPPGLCAAASRGPGRM